MAKAEEVKLYYTACSSCGAAYAPVTTKRENDSLYPVADRTHSWARNRIRAMNGQQGAAVRRDYVSIYVGKEKKFATVLEYDAYVATITRHARERGVDI